MCLKFQPTDDIQLINTKTQDAGGANGTFRGLAGHSKPTALVYKLKMRLTGAGKMVQCSFRGPGFSYQMVAHNHL